MIGSMVEPCYFKKGLEMKNIVSFVIAIFVSAVVFGQDAKTTQCVAKDCAFKMNLDSSVTVYDFDGGAVVAVDPEITVDICDKLTVGAGLPFYNDNNSYFDPRQLTWMLSNGVMDANGTGLSDIQFFATYNVFDGKFDLIKCMDKVWLNVSGGIGIPLDGVYSSNDTTYNIGGNVGASWGNISLEHDVKYTIVDQYSYIAPFSSFVEGDVYEGVSSLSWNSSDIITISLDITQINADEYNLILVGPSIDLKLTSNSFVSAGFGIPVDDETPGGELDAAFNFGLGLQF